MTASVSVVLCCHNSVQRLPSTLKYLAAVNVPPGVDWEVLVVDNASTDDTAACAGEQWARGYSSQSKESLRKALSFSSTISP